MEKKQFSVLFSFIFRSRLFSGRFGSCSSFSFNCSIAILTNLSLLTVNSLFIKQLNVICLANGASSAPVSRKITKSCSTMILRHYSPLAAASGFASAFFAVVFLAAGFLDFDSVLSDADFLETFSAGFSAFFSFEDGLSSSDSKSSL